ncbi:cytochrome C oxidase subunit IV family protein [Buchnera aphidicola]|uniref:Cytochrome bo(3) ubiquinol oxidase subunit 4 n=1 Tax=Buchnera aphidicola subsp. Tuberolachnus salignus TaxID=98804 RepID=A0A160SXM6_BUCTT|nr:cytochrome C oxidase subunit IV family protein [Buchnera aphidicola]CUR53275.1 Cytochrome bo(3) ubiquinol oxidase subunit 4 [Buchnera aphidicola (Tuberolachnus salignus)]
MLTKKNIFFFLKSPVIGFLILLILTTFTFFFIIFGNCSYIVKKIIIILNFFVQIFIHGYYFIYVKKEFKRFWNIISLLFTFLIIFIIFLGSLWIMKNLNH